MRVLRRRRIQDYQLRSTTDQSDLKADDDSISMSDTQVDGIITDVSKFALLRYMSCWENFWTFVLNSFLLVMMLVMMMMMMCLGK